MDWTRIFIINVLLLQFVIGNDGITGLTYEHSPSEGQPIAVMTDFLVTNMYGDKAYVDLQRSANDIQLNIGFIL